MLYKENPFYILDVNLEASRREIADAAEERSFILDPKICSEARSTLTTPQRRIAAEVHWFVDCSADDVADIKDYIENSAEGSSDSLQTDRWLPLTQLNINLARIDTVDFNNDFSAKYYILGLSRLFESIDPDSVLDAINDKRTVAGFPQITRLQDISDAISGIRAEIHKAVTQKLEALPKLNYVNIVTSLSENYSDHVRYKGHAVLEDIISDYQLSISDILNKKSASIVKTAEYIGQNANKIIVSDAVEDMLDNLYAWDKLAQPLQLGALTKGSSHIESEKLLNSLRILALKLHNDYGLSSESLVITEAVQEVFKELPEYEEMLSEDRETLESLIQQQKLDEILDPILDEVSNAVEAVKTAQGYSINTAISNLVTLVRKADQLIRENSEDKESSDSLRSALGILVCSLSIDLHNEQEKTEEALRLVRSIKQIFFDIPDLRSKLIEDENTLSKLIADKEASEAIINGLAEITAIQNSFVFGSDNGIKVTNIINKMVELDRKLKSVIDDLKTQNESREQLGNFVRSTAIVLHNEKHDATNALRLAKAIKQEFSDLRALSKQLDDDINTLTVNASIQRVNASSRYTGGSPTRSYSSSSSSSSGSSALWTIGLIVGFVAMFLLTMAMNS